MKKFKFSLLMGVLFFSSFIMFAQKPNIHILATGGTIAGVGSSATTSNYTAGQVAIGALLDAVPEIQDIANVTGEQVVRIGSQDMNDEVWLILAKRINELLSKDNVDGIVITHGTDTMEETAFFLSLTVNSKKPVVLIGAMRPSTALSADGPLNLYNAIVVASDKDSKGKGVMVTMNGIILDAFNVTKTNTGSVETFKSPNAGYIGYVYNGKPFYTMKPIVNNVYKFDVTKLNSLPKVGIVYSYSNIDSDMVTPMLNNGYNGIVHAGVGNGNIHKNVFPVLEKARKKGIQVVRSSRVPTGPTTLDAEVDDAALQFIASQSLNPQKSRVLLMLSLTKTQNWKEIQKYFSF